MKGFSGFPDGKQRFTSMPNVFFSDLLPTVDNLAELKVTLYAFWALSQQDGKVRYLRLADFLNDIVFMGGMGANPTVSAENIVEGIERAVARGTLLQIKVESSEGHYELYFMNTQKGRAAVEGITKGEWRPYPDADENVSLLLERPNIFILYEQNIGPLTPMIADQLRDAEQAYPTRWIEEAIQAAVENNARSWRYITAILRRWQQEGKDSGTHRRNSDKDIRKPIPDEYKDIVKK
jgi:DnaD/phage-associated family protein